jgi:hypothetical protein
LRKFQYILIVLLFYVLDGYTQNIIANYPLDGKANDISGNNNHGQIFGTIENVEDRFGNGCSAMKFDGSSGFIEVPNSYSLNTITNTFSVSVWLNLNNTVCLNDIKWFTILCKGKGIDETINNPAFRVQYLQTMQQSTVSINTDFTEPDFLFAQHLIPTNKWLFFTLVYDGALVKVYFDAVKIWEFPYSKPIGFNNESLLIGKDEPGAIEYFCGTMDDLKIYSKPLTETEISTYYNEIPPVNNNEEFVMECLPNIIKNNDVGKCGGIVNYITPKFDAKCANVLLQQLEGKKTGEYFEVGQQNNLVFEATSSTGYIKTCYSSIEVVDKEIPTLNCKKDTIIKIKDITIKPAFNYEKPYYTDNCKIKSFQQTSGLKSGDIYPFAITQNKFDVIDVAGNKNTCVQNVTFILDTAKIKVPDIEHILTDSVKNDGSLKFKNEYITLVIYDDGQQDNDTVSIFLNNKEIVYKSLITTKNIGTITKIIKLDSNVVNTLVIKAWNVGKYSPNTLRIDFFEGDYSNNLATLLYKKPHRVKIAHSLPGTACGMLLTLKP